MAPSISSPEDILSSSLQSLYDYTPVSFSGEFFTHKPSGLTLMSADMAPANWALHASSIWIASLFLANHIDDIALPPSPQGGPVSVLELGAGFGLPGILLTRRTCGKAVVTLSDYPDDAILSRLKENVKMNSILPSSVRVLGHSWGQNTAALGTFDIVLAADTIWNSDLHLPFCQTLSRVLRQTEEARIYIVAGLHTGRWTVQRFLEQVEQLGLGIDSMKERKVDCTFDSDANECRPMERDWKVERDNEGVGEQRDWVVWIVLRWVDIP